VGREPDKNNASRRLRVGINELAEVLVFGENDTFFPDSMVHHGLIIYSWGDFRHGKDVMAGSAEGPNDCVVTALIREEAHWSAFGSLAGRRWSQENSFLVGDSVGRVADGSLDVHTG